MSIPDAPWIGKCKEDYYEKKLYALCEWCGEEIYVGDSYYDLQGEIVCDSCIIDCSRTAEED